MGTVTVQAAFAGFNQTQAVENGSTFCRRACNRTLDTTVAR